MNYKMAFLAGLGYGQKEPGEVIASLKKIGYEGIEWTTSHFDPDKPIPELKALVAQTRDAGMEVSRIMAHEDLVSLDDEARRARIDRTVRVIQMAGECDIANVGTMTGPAPWDRSAPRVGVDISESAAWDQVFEAYEAFTGVAKEAGCIISSEGVFGMVAHDFYTHKFMMDQLDPEIHKVNLDPSHGVLHGNLDVGWVVRQWGDRIAHVHLKDAVGVPEPGKFLFPLLGEGNVNWRDFFGALDEIEFDGYCSVEFESFGYHGKILKNDTELAAQLSMEQIRKLRG